MSLTIIGGSSASAPVTRFSDSFAADSLASYTFPTGASTDWTVTGGELAPANTNFSRPTPNGFPSTFSNVYAKMKFKLSGSLAAGLGLYARGIDASNYLYVNVGTNGTVLATNKRDAGVGTALASFVLSSALTLDVYYWIEASFRGNGIETRLYEADPSGSVVVRDATTYTLVGADATKYGSGIAGSAGIFSSPGHTSQRIDDLVLAKSPWDA